MRRSKWYYVLMVAFGVAIVAAVIWLIRRLARQSENEGRVG
jgi:flagellar biogenesis protein FliO